MKGEAKGEVKGAMSRQAAISPPLVPDVALPGAPESGAPLTGTSPPGQTVRAPSPLDTAWRAFAIKIGS